MKEIYDIIDKLVKEFEENGNSLYFEVNGHTYETDTGYAMDGIKYFVKELKEELAYIEEMNFYSNLKN